MLAYVIAFHIIAMVAWMAGMLYLPRLFVYHSDAPKGGELDVTFSKMEKRLLGYIMTPAMAATWAFGLLLLYMQDFEPLHHGYMHVKILCVLLMSGLHGFFSASARKFANGQNTRSAKFWRVINEAPTLLMIVIVIMIVAKPF